MDKVLDKPPVRPERFEEEPLPTMPAVDPSKPDEASVEYSEHRTHLSRHRTHLSEHRTDLSEFRTDLSTERTDMSMRRTGMSFQRTRLSAERTLMSVIRTSLSLISFGFTIFQLLHGLAQAGTIHVAPHAARNFGVMLVALGILLLIVGIIYHLQFMLGLRHIRNDMQEQGLIYAQSHFPPSFTLVTAFVLLAIGVFAITSMIFQMGPFY